MKHIFIIIGIGILLFTTSNLSAQKKCKVLIPEIDSIYKGKCKKGLAHGKGTAIGVDTYKGRFTKGLPNGKGTYTWANGDIYTGQWRDGMRNGEGQLSIKVMEKDSILDGLWENNQFLGPKPKPPKVTYITGIDRYSFYKSGGTKHRILINLQQNGSRNTSINNLLIVSSKGVETNLGNLFGYEFIDFPVKIKLSYQTLNKTRSAYHKAILEFEITEPADWRLEIHN